MCRMKGSILIVFMVVVRVRCQIITSCSAEPSRILNQYPCDDVNPEINASTDTSPNLMNWICADNVTPHKKSCTLSGGKANIRLLSYDQFEKDPSSCEKVECSTSCLGIDQRFKVHITCGTNVDDVYPNIRIYENITGIPCCETSTAEVSNVLPFEPVYYPVEVCNLDEETVHLTVKEFYFKLYNEKAALPDDQFDMKSLFHKPVKECEDRVEDLKFMGYSEVTFVNSPDSVLRKAARRALNIL